MTLMVETLARQNHALPGMFDVHLAARQRPDPGMALVWSDNIQSLSIANGRLYQLCGHSFNVVSEIRACDEANPHSALQKTGRDDVTMFCESR